MKRVLLLSMALCVAASAAFAQKKAVSQAQSIAKGNNADFAEARTLIKGALENAETKDDPKTWYVAGFVEDQQFSAERMKEMLGQQPNQSVMYTALLNVYPYLKKSYELDQAPDAKGKIKPKYTKDIKGIMTANHVYYVNGGAFYFDERDYKKAYDCFEQYLAVANDPMFAGEAIAVRDTMYQTVQYYSALAALQMNDHDLALAALERAKDNEYKQSEIYQYMHFEYEQLKDTVSMEKVLKEGMEKMPEDEYFLLHLINLYIYSNRNEEAIYYLEKAIADKPNSAQLYDVLGSVYETGTKEMDKAEQAYSKALEFDPEFVSALSNLGRVYYNQAINIQADANMISDNKLYQEELAKAKDMFRKALPYFEKAYSLKPDQTEYMIALRGIYYNLSMSKEFDEIEAKLGAE
ncbi:tetratricopeptide (TPR) repeat protein [Parabacteroides sp. PFB2-12]|uniref:tetratricopeptide repeat protein n=1 Tax=unclassified Parabacteroides TaxID=2649774 RepID=UPI002474BBED|nr:MULTISPECIES: tetratricopeptide repeat protein [unclassified Parabacteroides]MDH6343975.1 tetratricopeptide (TPR) repeat protein [Parabacteroides sp. PM6-13]MDH6391664.1 tetratricopeptide (TPR) repeat protein [Parabacteroides sp. PFB2-12]